MVLWLRSHAHSVGAADHTAELMAFVAASVRTFSDSAPLHGAADADVVERAVAWWAVLGEMAAVRAVRLQLQRAHVCNTRVPDPADAIAWSCSNDRFEAAICGREAVPEAVRRSALGVGRSVGTPDVDAELLPRLHVGGNRWTRCWLTHTTVVDTFDAVWRALGARTDCGIKLGGTEQPAAALGHETAPVARAGTGKVIGRHRVGSASSQPEPAAAGGPARPTAERLLSRRQRRAAAFGAKDVTLTLGTFRLRVHPSHMRQTAVVVSLERFLAGGLQSGVVHGEGDCRTLDRTASAALLHILRIVEEALSQMGWHAESDCRDHVQEAST